ncbi:unnamed protein product [Symbiodinium microadriaticum]|nr:unnamed protein product [Symbiodinium sp. KB8]CAE7909131.1 unnamed protein product [Symbiodinium microadriaticum]
MLLWTSSRKSRSGDHQAGSHRQGCHPPGALLELLLRGPRRPDDGRRPKGSRLAKRSHVARGEVSSPAGEATGVGAGAGGRQSRSAHRRGCGCDQPTLIGARTRTATGSGAERDKEILLKRRPNWTTRFRHRHTAGAVDHDDLGLLQGPGREANRGDKDRRSLEWPPPSKRNASPPRSAKSPPRPARSPVKSRGPSPTKPRQRSEGEPGTGAEASPQKALPAPAPTPPAQPTAQIDSQKEAQPPPSKGPAARNDLGTAPKEKVAKAAGAEEDEYEYESTSSSSVDARRPKPQKEDRRHGPRAEDSWPYLPTAAAVAPLVAAAMTSSMTPSPGYGPPGNFNPLGYNGAYANWNWGQQMYPSMQASDPVRFSANTDGGRSDQDLGALAGGPHGIPRSLVRSHPDVIFTDAKEPHKKFVERLPRDSLMHEIVRYYEPAEIRARSDVIIVKSALSRNAEDLLSIAKADQPEPVTDANTLFNRLHAFFMALEYLNAPCRCSG